MTVQSAYDSATALIYAAADAIVETWGFGQSGEHGAGANEQFQDAEIPSGSINGVNPIFVLSVVPSPSASLILTRNGLALRVGADYTLAGDVITFVSEAIPQPTDILQAWYRS